MANKGFDINTRFTGLPYFETPYEMLVYYDEEILDGTFSPYKWQREILRGFGRELEPGALVRELLRANNGSGKSQFILAPCVVWLASQFPECLCCVTSSSHKQMNDQTERYVKALAMRMNAVHKESYPDGFWKIIQGSISSAASGSFIDLFVTDEAGKFEGRHPIRPGRRFGFFFDECKSINEDLYDAAYRCNGMSHRLDQSSPGAMHGHFYDTSTDDDPASIWNTHVATAYDCPHLNELEINELIRKKGISDPLVRSSIFAEFTSLDAKLVLPREVMNENNKRWRDKSFAKATGNLFDEPRAGLDLAAGGDEIVLDVWHGNKQLGLESFVMRDTTQTTKEIINLIKNYPGLDATRIFADDGGVGRGIIDQLHEKGYEVQRVLNQWRAYDTTRYANIGTEMWFDFKRFVEEHRVKFIEDKKQMDQLCSRYYKIQTNTGKLILESKAEAKSNGHGSPDRGDACVLAWKGLRYPLDYMVPKKKEEMEGVTVAQLLAGFDKRRGAKFRMAPDDEVEFKGYKQDAYLTGANN
mgnify:FL=1